MIHPAQGKILDWFFLSMGVKKSLNKAPVFTYLHLGMHKPLLRSSYDFYYAFLKQNHKNYQEIAWLIGLLLVIRAA